MFALSSCLRWKFICIDRQVEGVSGVMMRRCGVEFGDWETACCRAAGDDGGTHARTQG